MTPGGEPQHLVLDLVECPLCGARTYGGGGGVPAHAGSRRARCPGVAARRPAGGRSLQLRWYRRLEWWLNTSVTADVHRTDCGPLLHPPEVRCWSSYCTHCSSRG